VPLINRLGDDGGWCPRLGDRPVAYLDAGAIEDLQIVNAHDKAGRVLPYLDGFDPLHHRQINKHKEL
jgi:hypothetical protein